MLTPKEIAYAVTKALDEKKGMDIKLLKIDRVSSLADYFLICTGTSNTHVKTLCDYAQLLQGVLSVVAQGLDVGVGGTGADQEVIGKAGNPVDFQKTDPHTLLGVQGSGGLIGHLFSS